MYMYKYMCIHIQCMWTLYSRDAAILCAGIVSVILQSHNAFKKSHMAKYILLPYISAQSLAAWLFCAAVLRIYVYKYLCLIHLCCVHVHVPWLLCIHFKQACVVPMIFTLIYVIQCLSFRLMEYSELRTGFGPDVFR